MNERIPGWYWVKTDYQNEWEAAQFDGDDWHVTRADQEWNESMLDEVGQRIPSPDEPWTTVPTEPTKTQMDSFTMVSTWLDSKDGCAYKLSAQFDGAIGEPYYKAMIKASPKP